MKTFNSVRAHLDEQLFMSYFVSPVIAKLLCHFRYRRIFFSLICIPSFDLIVTYFTYRNAFAQKVD